MSIVIATDVVLDASDDINGDSPCIGWDNVVSRSSIVSTTQEAAWPTTNLGNPSTYHRWQGTAIATEYLTIRINRDDPIDYIGIARHNLWSAGIQASVETQDTSGGAWTERLAAVQLPDDAAAIFRIAERACYAARLKMAAGLVAPRIGAIYCGKLTVVPRRLYVGHAPITLSRQTRVHNGRSEAGDFLGRIELQRMNGTTAPLRNLPADWVRAELDPMLKFATASPFFWAWRPLTYPLEVGYAWLTNDAVPSNQSPNGLMQVDLAMGGIA